MSTPRETRTRLTLLFSKGPVTVDAVPVGALFVHASPDVPSAWTISHHSGLALVFAPSYPVAVRIAKEMGAWTDWSRDAATLRGAPEIARLRARACALAREAGGRISGTTSKRELDAMQGRAGRA